MRPRISVLENKVALEGEWGHIKGPRIWYERALTGKNGIIWSSKRVMIVMAYDTLAILKKTKPSGVYSNNQRWVGIDRKREKEEEKEGTLLYRTSADEFRKSLFCNP